MKPSEEREWLHDFIDKTLDDGFTGNIRINAFRGGIGNVERNESFKPQPKQEAGT